EKTPYPDKIPVLLDEGTRAYNIAQMLRQGKSVHEIAEKYGIENTDVNKLIRQGLTALAEDAAPIILNWSVINMTRLEAMIAKLYDNLLDAEDHPNDSVFARIQSLIAQEKEIVTMLMAGSKSKDLIGDLSETMRIDGKLYEEGNVALHQQNEQGVVEREVPIADLDNPFPDGIFYQDKK
ncbi:MAG: hypothetical protein ABI835_02850, partial [Chloroflexota bacterium]